MVIAGGGGMICSLLYQADSKEFMNEILVDGARWRELHFESRMYFMLFSGELSKHQLKRWYPTSGQRKKYFYHATK